MEAVSFAAWATQRCVCMIKTRTNEKTKYVKREQIVGQIEVLSYVLKETEA